MVERERGDIYERGTLSFADLMEPYRRGVRFACAAFLAWPITGRTCTKGRGLKAAAPVKALDMNMRINVYASGGLGTPKGRFRSNVIALLSGSFAQDPSAIFRPREYAPGWGYFLN